MALEESLENCNRLPAVLVLDCSVCVEPSRWALRSIPLEMAIRSYIGAVMSCLVDRGRHLDLVVVWLDKYLRLSVAKIYRLERSVIRS